jgi:hypothetical protein
MANRQEYIERLKLAIEHLHKCSAVHAETVAVHEKFQERTVWQGEVEVFAITGHPRAKHAYGWSTVGDGDVGECFTAVLGVPLVGSPEKAVRASIVAHAKKTLPK